MEVIIIYYLGTKLSNKFNMNNKFYKLLEDNGMEIPNIIKFISIAEAISNK